MISLVVPTRGRFERFAFMAASARATADDPGNVEVVAVVDEDEGVDYSYLMGAPSKVVVVSAPMSEDHWNIGMREASGDILGYMADDVVFRTPGWDSLILNAFSSQPDTLRVVHGDDERLADRLGTHGFVSREWIERAGFLFPPQLRANCADIWLCQMADELGRRVFVKEVKIRHEAGAYDPRWQDLTYWKKVERARGDDNFFQSRHSRRLMDETKRLLVPGS